MTVDDALLTKLLLDARDGDRWSFSSFVRHTQDRLQTTLSFLGSPQTAEDLAQETYLRAFRSLQSFRGDAPARSWLLTIARRTAADSIRRETRHRRLHALLPGQPTTNRGDTTELQMLIAGLDEDRRVAFVLTQISGLSYEQAAAVCGCAVGTIRSRVSRARDQLAAEYSGISRPSASRSRSTV